MWRVLMLFQLLCVGNLSAQKHSLDSLEELIVTTRLDTAKVLALHELASKLYVKDNDRALKYAQHGRMLAQRLQHANGMAKMLFVLSRIYYQRGAFSEAFEHASKALEMGDSLQNNELIVSSFNVIASIHLRQKQFEPAIENFKRAYTLSQAGYIHGATETLINLAGAFLEYGAPDSAMRYVRKGIQLNMKFRDKKISGSAYLVLGDVLFQKGDPDRAIVNYNRVVYYAEDLGDDLLKASAFYRLGKLYNQQQDPESALPYLLESAELSQNLGYYYDLENLYKTIAESYALLGNAPKAYHYQKKYVHFYDSIYLQRSSDQLALRQAKAESDLKQAQIELLLKDAQINQHALESQRIWLFFMIGFLSLAILFALVLIDSNSRIKNINLQLKQKNKEIRAQAKQLSNLNLTKDKLFSVIGHDLRSPLASLKALISILGHKNLSHEEFSSIIEKLHRRLDSVYDDLDNLLQWAQSQLKGLQVNTESFNLKELADAKIELFKEAARLKNVKLINEMDEDCYACADKNHIRIVLRNLLTNAIKFTPAGGTVKVQCRQADDQFEVSVSDSGVGIGMEDLSKLFNADTHFTKRGTNEEKGIGIGLLLVKEFIEKNGGSIWVRSEFGKGSTFTFTVKCDPEKVLRPVFS